MADLEPARGVFSGIVPNRPDLLADAMRWLTEDHFTLDAHRVLWRVMCRYYDVGHGVVTRKVLNDLVVKKLEASAAIVMMEVYDLAAATDVSEAEFRFYVDSIRQLRAEALTGETFTTALELLTRGGEIEGKEVEPGADSAWAYTQDQYARIAGMSSRDVAPEGDVWTEPSEILLDYSERKRKAVEGDVGIRTGVRTVDSTIGGLQPGDLALIVGYIGSGKSQFCTQVAWHASVEQGKNVLYATTETSRNVTRRRLLARHSRLPKWELGAPINTKALKDGSLTEAEEGVLKRIAHDLDHGARSGAYGHLYLAQIPPRPSLAYIDALLRRVQTMFPVDLLVIDYLALLTSERRRGTEREEMTDLVKQAKVLATTHDDGKGIPLVSPWQVTRAAYDKAVLQREYTKAITADTSESEKSADILLSILALDDEKGRLRVQFLKNRDGDLPPIFDVDVDYRCAWFGQSSELRGVQDYRNEEMGGSRVG